VRHVRACVRRAELRPLEENGGSVRASSLPDEVAAPAGRAPAAHAVGAAEAGALHGLLLSGGAGAGKTTLLTAAAARLGAAAAGARRPRRNMPPRGPTAGR